MPKRIAFVTNALTGAELTGGKHDTSRVYSLLLRPELGQCNTESPSPRHDCATKTQFTSSLDLLLSEWDHRDQLLLYFSGHGQRVRGEYCLQFGQHPHDHYPFKSLLLALKIGGVSRAIIVLDTCYSGAALSVAGKAVSQSTRLPDMEALPTGIAIIVSSREYQQSHELHDGSASVFTRLLCEGIETGLSGTVTRDDKIGVEDIVMYVNRRLDEDEFRRYEQRAAYGVPGGAEATIWISNNITTKSKSGAIPAITTSSAPHGNIRNEAELRLAYEKTIVSKQPCEGADVADLVWDLVERFADHLRQDLPRDTHRQPGPILRKLGLYSPLRDQLHHAAVLCFCDRPDKYINSATATFVVGDPSSHSFRHDLVVGPLGVQLTRLLELTMARLDSTTEFGADGARVVTYEIPMGVVRELISNAIAHRDYRGGSGSVEVSVDDKWVEVRSPGRFPQEASWGALLASDRASCPIDTVISYYLKSLLKFEGIGRGFSVFRDHIAKQGPESISYRELPGPITLVRVRRGRMHAGTEDGAKVVTMPSDKLGLNRRRALDSAESMLAMTLARRDALLAAREETSEVDAEIIRHKRRLRAGGQLKSGDVLRYDGAERFLLLEPLGRGGFATVWRVRDRASGEVRAAKVLHGQFAQDRTRRERFFRGARVMAGLTHDAIVEVIVPHANDGGFHYFIMEHLVGGDLRSAVLEGRIVGITAMPHIMQVGTALIAAHQAGLIHRDVKPANILLDEHDNPKLTDFDMVGGAHTTGGTRTGAMGTFLYAPPEMLSRPQDADLRADIYSLGMTTLFVLRGSDLPMAVLRDAAPVVASLDCPQELKDVVMRAINWSPGSRYADVSQFCGALRESIDRDLERRTTAP